MAGMGMSLRVVVPPHPLIGHWLCVLRDRTTPAPLFATAMAELGRWLSYEAIRDWLPQRSVTIESPHGNCGGQLVDASAPLLAIPVLRGGLGLWQGAQSVLPAARVAHVGLESAEADGEPRWFLDDLPERIGARVGVLVVLPVLATGRTLAALVQRLHEQGVQGARLRVITTVAAAPGLARIAAVAPDLSIYCACIDPELDPHGQVIPGFGDASSRLYGAGPLEQDCGAVERDAGTPYAEG